MAFAPSNWWLKALSFLFDVDPLSGAVERISFSDGSLLITRTENVQAVLDANAELRASNAWRGADNTMWHVATVPQTVLDGWLKDFNRGKPSQERLFSWLDPRDDWQTFMWRRLNSSEYYKLKTAPVHV